ncbi:hypothetical protein DSO57_1023734 [Entomophthora muscae]|uniref:Uncharacterized protein n=1 Tax=Entomophthora muscae TaxID=34485 RepID=A0ACC2RHH3_9FUNG|nr:hypothetical protein DSO57_1023734 [Entomophthora muscae]
MSAIAYTERIEQSLCQYIPHMVQEVLNYKGLDRNWIIVITNHFQGSKEVMSSLIHQMKQINLAIISKPNNQVVAAEDAKMLHKDVLKLFDHYQNLGKEIKEIHFDNTLLSSQAHTDIPKAQKVMNEVISMRLDNHNLKIIALEEEVDTIAKEKIKIKKSSKKLGHPYTSCRTR